MDSQCERTIITSSEIEKAIGNPAKALRDTLNPFVVCFLVWLVHRKVWEEGVDDEYISTHALFRYLVGDEQAMALYRNAKPCCR
jgi:hypothetical protein